MKAPQGLRGPLWLTFSLGMWLLACGSKSQGPDSGTPDDGADRIPCVNNIQCTYPETCQDGYCDQVTGPQPEDNRLAGAFSCQVNRDYGDSEVKGKFQGKYVYMEFPGCLVEYYEGQTPKAILWIDGLVTNELLLRIEIQIPPDSPVSTPLAFGDAGKVTGLYKHLTIKDDSIVGEKTVAEVTAGTITFAKLGLNAADRVQGTFVITLQSLE